MMAGGDRGHKGLSLRHGYLITSNPMNTPKGRAPAFRAAYTYMAILALAALTAASCGVGPITRIGGRSAGATGGTKPIFSIGGPSARASVAPEPAPEVSQNAVTIAVANIEAEGTATSDAMMVAEILRSELVRSGAFRVADKRNMDKMLAEQAFQQTGCTNTECAVKLGKVLNVRKMVVGSFGKLMGQYMLNVHFVDVETGEIVYSDSAKGATADDLESSARVLIRNASTNERVIK